MTRVVVFHLHEADGTVTAKCKGYPDLKVNAPTVAEAKTLADALVRERIARDARVDHFENIGIDWWQAA